MLISNFSYPSNLRPFVSYLQCHVPPIAPGQVTPFKGPN